MLAVRTLVALSVATLAAACASPGYTDATPPSADAAPMTMGAAGSMAAKEPRWGDDKGMPIDMSRRHYMMADQMAMMQMMKAMMADRMPPAAAGQ